MPYRKTQDDSSCEKEGLKALCHCIILARNRILKIAIRHFTVLVKIAHIRVRASIRNSLFACRNFSRKQKCSKTKTFDRSTTGSSVVVVHS